MKCLYSRLAALSLIFLAFAPSGAAQDEARLAQPLPIDPAIRQGVLDNGLRYFLRKNERPEKRAELRLVLRAGALQEDEDQLGIAHFLEHMAFNGSVHFSKNELIDYLESTGARFGPDLNAYTSFGETVYLLQARTDSLSLLETGLLILEDWAAGLRFDEEEIDKERGVVIAEWRTRLSPEQRLQQKIFPIQYAGSRYADRLPIGDPAIIDTADYETIRRYYRDWYRPELMAIVAAGDFDLDWMEAEIRRRFARLRNPESARPWKRYHIPDHEETRFAIFSEKEYPFTQIQLSYRHPKQPLATIGDYRAALIRSLYNRLISARLYERQQRGDTSFTFAFSGYGPDLGDRDSYTISAFTAEGQALEGLRAVLVETWRALAHGFVESELERQKAEILRNAEKAAAESDKTQSATFAARLAYHYLEEQPVLSAQQALALYRELLPGISVEDIHPLLRGWLKPQNRSVVFTGPEKPESPLPLPEEILSLLAEVENMSLEPYVDEVVERALPVGALVPAEIVERLEHEELGVSELHLANGVRLVLKPTDFKNDEIMMQAFSPGGHSLYPDEDYQSAVNAANLVSLSGIADFSPTDLQKLLAGKNVTAGPYIAELYEGFSGNCSKAELPLLFQLIYLYAAAPRADSAALRAYLTRQRAVVRNMFDNPYYYYANARNQIKYDYHPRRRMTTLQDLEAVSFDRAFAIYQDRFADAGDFTFVFVGAFHPDSLTELARTYLGNLPSAGRKENWRDVGANWRDRRLDTTLVGGEAPKTLVELAFHGDFDDQPEARHAFYSLMDLLRIKLRESMREEQGGVYGVRLNGTIERAPRFVFRVTLSFDADPAEADTLVAIALAEIQKVKSEGAAESDLRKIRETQRQTRIKNLKENSFWLGQLVARYRERLSLEGILLPYYEHYIERLDSDMLRKAAIRYFDFERMIRISLIPATRY
jgi:zinc protease